MLYLINIDVLFFVYGSYMKVELERRRDGSRKFIQEIRVRIEEDMIRIYYIDNKNGKKQI